MTRVAITGATGIFGKALCAHLERDPAVDEIIGVARRPFDPAAHGWTKMTFRSGDVLQPDQLDAAFKEVDTVVHLAFTVLDRGTHPEQVRLVNVEGSANVFAAAVRAGAKRIVYASSVAAYGAWPDNPVPITESHPTRGNPGFYYAEHKAEVETLLDSFEVNHPDVEVVRIRPCIVVGPNSVDLFRGPVPTPLVGVFLSRLLPAVIPDPGLAPVQFVHEDDVAEVFALAVTRPKVRGAYNLAGGGTMEAADLASAIGAVRLPFPAGLARRLVDVAYRARISPTGSAWIDMGAHPVVVDTTRARTELGWIPKFDTRTALEDMLERYRAASPLPRLLS
ncbi:MAG: NAD-dependent epimerase/dehydratase family protein [Nitriliruptorales bacterium]|nr:NAD-dependent epimerase/dehydratase family protein [Nitriliruptorales bacterium]